MKKIVPFNNVLEFNTDVKEITAISLEHKIEKYPDTISGVFYISGEYKIAEALLDKEQFSFELPFDIALTDSYEMDTLLVDIDDFRYNLISNKNLKVNIDLYIDGEITPPIPRETNEESIKFLNREEPSKKEELIIEDVTSLEQDIIDNMEEEPSEKEEDVFANTEITKEDIQPKRIELLKEMLTETKEKDNMEELPKETIINENTNIINNDNEEKYVTYRVYVVEETDTVDTILTKYNITKELLSDYNNLENITPGDKLIIPTNEE